MIAVSERGTYPTALLLEIDHRNFSVTILVFFCNSRYNSLRNPVPELVSRSPAPQGDDELEGPFQSSDRSFGQISEGS